MTPSESSNPGPGGLPPITHDAARGRFACSVRGLECVCDYQLADGVMVFTHTAVPPALSGQGIAAALVQHALDWARANGLRVRPLCSYVAVYMQRHAQTQDLLAT
jgi:predicted GNAT family acetyltransferase